MWSFEKLEKTNVQFKKFIENKAILVADTSALSRESLATILVSMGAKMRNIILSPDFDSAQRELLAHKPEVVICDYSLGKRCSLDLIQTQRNQVSDLKNSLFILITADTSQVAVAKAAEEEIDTYILKPFTNEVLRNAILKGSAAKVTPDEYVQSLEQGKALLSEGKLDDAEKVFERARSLDSSPALSCFYLGQVEMARKMPDKAVSWYMQGLQHNKIHYKCLNGLYEVLMEQKKYADAYAVVKRITSYFPANPQRLTAVLKLAILTHSYDDVEKYYRIFTQVSDRNEELIRYICAALVVCGKYYLQKNIKTRAMELFQQAMSASDKNMKVLKEVILALLDFKLDKEAREFAQSAAAKWPDMKEVIERLVTSGPEPKT